MKALFLFLFPIVVSAQSYNHPYQPSQYQPQDYSQQNLRVQELQQQSKLNHILNNIERDRVRSQYDRLQSQAQELIRKR